jgi:molybdenum cofactor biosynthesis enzyme MoaA
MSTAQHYYKAYYMITSKCNLACSYCVLENAPFQLEQEISLNDKMSLITHMYSALNFRSITISGGEALITGKNAPADFICLLGFLKQFKSLDDEKNMQIQLYTNGLMIDESVADAMIGIVDEISINIDSIDKETLLKIGRNRKVSDDYFSKVLNVCEMFSKRNIAIKLHTVVSQYNYKTIAQEVKLIYRALKEKGVTINNWKLYQYMSYDVPTVDLKHQIKNQQFELVRNHITAALKEFSISLHFKNNSEMNESLFNILPYGNVQYMIPGDTWKSSKRTDNLLKYDTMQDFFRQNDISESIFNKYHTFKPKMPDAER